MDKVRLSKRLSYILRHHPDSVGLRLDEDGALPVDALLEALHVSGWPGLTRTDLEELVRTSKKQRFEILGDRIRATYGHSVPVTIRRDTAVPPDVLYHGTARRRASAIQKEGLRPMGRQYVHLSADPETAREVGRRRDPHPLILQVAARDAHRDGIRFFVSTDHTWMAEPIPPVYLRPYREN